MKRERRDCLFIVTSFSKILKVFSNLQYLRIYKNGKKMLSTFFGDLDPKKRLLEIFFSQEWLQLTNKFIFYILLYLLNVYLIHYRKHTMVTF